MAPFDKKKNSRQEDSDSDTSSEEEEAQNVKAGGNNRKTLTQKEAVKKVKKGGNDTMVDFFLQGDAKDKQAKQVEEGVVNFISDPPGVLNPREARKKRKKQIKRIQEMMREHQQQQAKQALEAKVQDYWKHFAQWPDSWHETREARQSQLRFAEEFKIYSLASHPNDAGVYKADPVVARSFKTFICIASGQVGVRNAPTLQNTPEYLTGSVIKPGQVLIAETVVVMDEVRFLKLPEGPYSAVPGGGWVPEEKESQQLFAEATLLETGIWWYRVACMEFVEVRLVPTYSRAFGTGWIMCPKEICVVSLRCLIEGQTWLQLADGRGWVFALKSKDAINQNHAASPVVMEQADKASLSADLAQFDLDGDGEIDEEELEKAMASGLDGDSGNAEAGLWQYQVLEAPVLSTGNVLNGSMLYPNETFVVDLRAPASGKKAKEVSTKYDGNTQVVLDRIWLRLYDGRGWVPKVDEHGKQLVRFTGAGNAQKKKAPKDKLPEETWMYGIV